MRPSSCLLYLPRCPLTAQVLPHSVIIIILNHEHVPIAGAAYLLCLQLHRGKQHKIISRYQLAAIIQGKNSGRTCK